MVYKQHFIVLSQELIFSLNYLRKENTVNIKRKLKLLHSHQVHHTYIIQQHITVYVIKLFFD